MPADARDTRGREAGRGNRGGTAGAVVAVGLRLALLAYAVAIVADVALQPGTYQWDFATYYRAGEASRAGRDPYDMNALTAFAGKPVELPFAYSPIALPIFALFSRLDFDSAYRLFLALKLACLVALAYLWKTRFLAGEPGLPFWLLCVFGFAGAIRADLVAGNVSLFEQLALWVAFDALGRDRPVRFGLLVVAASSFKLTPALFLLLLVAPGLPRRAGAFLAAAGAFLAIHGASLLAAPARYREFLTVAAGIDDRGADNPATLALLRDVGDLLERKGVMVPSGVELAAYALLAAGVVIVTALALRRSRGADPRLPVYVACLAFSLALPRFKDYAYILLLPPAYFVVRHLLPSRATEIAIVLLLLANTLPIPFGVERAVSDLFWAYYPWLLALGLWAIAATWMLRREASPRAGGPYLRSTL